MQLQLHPYGVLVGLGVSITLWLAEHWSQRGGLTERQFWLAAGWILIGALVGARAWHVVTDWQQYVETPLVALAIWQGGLSILGALMGGMVGVWGWQRHTNSTQSELWLLLDSFALALPWGQAVGRWGNYVNQELYGFPTRWPWGIFIDEEHRLPQFYAETHFHPLFAYEILAVLGLWVWLWWQARVWPLPASSRGLLAAQYLWGYAGLRFWLDFGRPDRPVVFGSLSLNQWLLLGVVVAGLTYWMMRQLRQPASGVVT